MPAVKIADNIYWVGVVDWNIRSFHGPAFHTPYGTTYNSYLIIDDKITLVDGVYAPFAEELIANIREIVDPAKIDIMVVNHIESDHSGAIPHVMDIAPNAKVVCTRQGKVGLQKHYFKEWDFQVVKTNDTINLGHYNLQFIEASMLHWPDSMFTYIPEAELLLSNDAFGQHLATSQRYADEVDQGLLMAEAAKYYANILLPFSDLILKKVAEIGTLGIKISQIAPSHGLIWRKDPSLIINAYVDWAKGVTKDKAVIVYDTMWNSTEKLARSILDGLVSEGFEVKLYKASVSDRNQVIADILDASVVFFGSSTINNGYLPTIAAYLDEMKGLKPKGKLVGCFGSQGWGGGAVKHMEEAVVAAGMNLVFKAPVVKWVPAPEELQPFYALGVEAAKQAKAQLQAAPSA